MNIQTQKWHIEADTDGRFIANEAGQTIGNFITTADAVTASLAPEAIEALRLLFNEVTFWTEGEPILQKQVSLDSQYAFEAWTKARAILARLEGGAS